MADFFSKIRKNIDKGAAIVSAKSNTLIETNKLKSEISTANKIKKDTLLAIGTKVYEEGKGGSFTIESVEALMTKVGVQEAKIADLEAKIKLIQQEEKEKLEEINREDAPVDVTAEEVVDVAVSEVAVGGEEEVPESVEEVPEVVEVEGEATQETTSTDSGNTDTVEEAPEEVSEEKTDEAPLEEA